MYCLVSSDNFYCRYYAEVGVICFCRVDDKMVPVNGTACKGTHRILIDTSIYTTKIDEFVCPPNISETIAVRIMKLAHRPRIASTTIKLISKPMLLSILLKIIQRIGAGPKRKSSPPFVYGDSADSVGFRFVDNLVLPSGRSI